MHFASFNLHGSNTSNILRNVGCINFTLLDLNLNLNHLASMPAVLVTGHCYTQNSPFSSPAMTVTIASTHCVYWRRDGQAEWAWVAVYITRWFVCPKAVTQRTYRETEKLSLIDTHALSLRPMAYGYYLAIRLILLLFLLTTKSILLKLRPNRKPTANTIAKSRSWLKTVYKLLIFTWQTILM